MRAREVMLAKLEAEVTARVHAQRERDQVRSRLYQAHLEERSRIARDLHDQIGQRTVVLKLGLHRLLDSTSDPRQRANLASLQRQVDAIGSDVRRIVNELRPAGLADFGLEAALRNLVEEVGVAGGLNIAFRVAGTPLDLSPEADTTLFRVVQEALTNVLRHAGPVGLVAVTLQYRAEAAVVTVEDDGLGFEPKDCPGGEPSGSNGFGLRGIRERLALIGGDCEIVSGSGLGTTVCARVTTREADRDDCNSGDPDRAGG